MLYNEHCKEGKDLQRKIDKLRDEGKDPSQPQKLERPRSSAPRLNAHTYPANRPFVPSPPPSRPMTDSQNTADESFMLLAGQRVSIPHLLAIVMFISFTVVRPWRCIQPILDYHAGNVGQPISTSRVCDNTTQRQRTLYECSYWDQVTRAASARKRSRQRC